jgi:integrase
VPHIAKLEEADPRTGFIEQVQYEILLNALPDRFKCLFVLGYHYGCRIGELRKIMWDQVDFEDGTITLQKSQTKAKTARVLPIYGDVREWLERQRQICTGARVFCYRKCTKELTKDGKAPVELPFGRHMDGWHEACTAAGLPELRFHDLRRSAVRNMVRAGIPESVARKISGHKTPSVFQRYNIVVDTDLDDAAKRMEDYTAEQKKKAEAAKLKLVKK